MPLSALNVEKGQNETTQTFHHKDESFCNSLMKLTFVERLTS